MVEFNIKKKRSSKFKSLSLVIVLRGPPSSKSLSKTFNKSGNPAHNTNKQERKPSPQHKQTFFVCVLVLGPLVCFPAK